MYHGGPAYNTDNGHMGYLGSYPCQPTPSPHMIPPYTSGLHLHPSPQFGTAQATFATITTTTPQYVNNTPYQPYLPPQHYQLYQPVRPSYPHSQVIDPNMPTMKQMRMELSVFQGGDPVE